MKHKDEIIRYANSPDNTKVWIKGEESSFWYLKTAPAWYINSKYIIDNKYATLRKAMADNYTIEIRMGNTEIWEDLTEDIFTASVSQYRVKSDKPTYYYQWEKLRNNKIYISDFMIDKDAKKNLIGDWRRVDASKRTWKEAE